MVTARVVRWLPAGEDPVEDYAMWHVVHEDGDEEDLGVVMMFIVKCIFERGVV